MNHQEEGPGEAEEGYRSSWKPEKPWRNGRGPVCSKKTTERKKSLGGDALKEGTGKGWKSGCGGGKVDTNKVSDGGKTYKETKLVSKGGKKRVKVGKCHRKCV